MSEPLQGNAPDFAARVVTPSAGALPPITTPGSVEWTPPLKEE